MVNLTKSTKSIKAGEIRRQWHLIDAKNNILGRMSTKIAFYLMGKNKSGYVGYLDTGDNVVVVNAAQVRLTGSKIENKTYSRYSGYPGGLKKVTLKAQLSEKPEEVIRHAVAGMLPKNKLKKKYLSKLYIFAGAEHHFTHKFKDLTKD